MKKFWLVIIFSLFIALFSNSLASYAGDKDYSSDMNETSGVSGSAIEGLNSTDVKEEIHAKEGLYDGGSEDPVPEISKSQADNKDFSNDMDETSGVSGSAIEGLNSTDVKEEIHAKEGLYDGGSEDPVPEISKSQADNKDFSNDMDETSGVQGIKSDEKKNALDKDVQESAEESDKIKEQEGIYKSSSTEDKKKPESIADDKNYFNDMNESSGVTGVEGGGKNSEDKIVKDATEEVEPAKKEIFKGGSEEPAKQKAETKPISNNKDYSNDMNEISGTVDAIDPRKKATDEIIDKIKKIENNNIFYNNCECTCKCKCPNVCK